MLELGDEEVVIVSAAAGHSWPDGGFEALDAHERRRAANFATSELRRRFEVAHLLLRVSLGQVMGCRAEDVRLRRTPCSACGGAHGKPALASQSRIHFNLTHTGDRALVAITRDCEVGIDAELGAGVDVRELASFFLSTQELKQLESLESAPAQAALAQWVRKEALLKAHGDGLNADPRMITLPMGLSTPSTERSAVYSGRRWIVTDVSLAGGVAAVAVPAPSRRIRHVDVVAALA